MPVESNIKSPGVYVNELNAFPNSVVPVATAVPAFIGYTPQASYEGRLYTNVPQKITSFADFQAIYCYPDQVKQYHPQYYLVLQKSQPAIGDFVIINDAYYSILPDPNTIYYLYNSIRLFYENGGGDAYIVSVGTYGDPSKMPMESEDQIVNPNIQLNDLINGLALLKNEKEATMYICPEATLLSVEDNGSLMKEMLLQCTKVQSAICIFDLIGGRNPDPVSYTNDIATFRNNTGDFGLSYGTAYYPFICTNILQTDDIDYTNLFDGDTMQLATVLNSSGNTDERVENILHSIENPPAVPLATTQYHHELIGVSKTYDTIIKHVLSVANIFPPSGAMAGVITTIDSSEGVWKAPANISIAGTASLPINLSEAQQENLNIDPVSGKSINAIRFFNGRGILVWGARTLDSNSLDWRYLSVRRTVIFLEQSCKLAVQSYIFQPNDKNTWEAVKSMIAGFLTSIWKYGGLLGSTPSDAFSVDCGLGTTMSPDDLLRGFMNVTIKVAILHPAEFIVLSFQQQMAASG